MRRVEALGLALMACVALAACPKAQMIILRNNSGHVVQVIHASPSGDRGAMPNTFPWFGVLRWPYLIDRGADRELMQSGLDNTIELKVADCRMWYQVPLVSNNGADIALQMEPDLAVYLAPYGVWDQRLDAKTQPAGFPISPTEQRCS